uniref:mitogen-activated protein kinase n=1 Tax=Esox lucius TaxID=8010 RepID=A0A6Q2YKV1_ESOLU
MESPVGKGFYRMEIQKTTWDVPEQYVELKAVGSGAYGTVCSAIDLHTKEKVAIKKLYRPFQSLIHAKRAYRELRLLRHIQNENVICLLNVFTPDSSLEKFQTFYLVMPFVAKDLGHIMKKRRLTDRVIVYLFYQLLRGLKYIHSAGIIHRDLKPGNIAVNENCELKILDFGLARHAESEMTGYVVTRWYRSPEIIFNWMHYSQSVDLWSAGCILAEMITGQVLFPGNDSIDQLKRILSVTGTSVLTQCYFMLSLPLIASNVLTVSLFVSLSPSICPSFFLSPSLSLCPPLSVPLSSSLPLCLSVPLYLSLFLPHSLFVSLSPSISVDLLERMLLLDPETRTTAKEALTHPYFSEYHDPESEPDSPPYDDSFESKELDVGEWKSLIHMEIMTFDPSNPGATAV